MFRNIEPIKEWKNNRNTFPKKSIIVIPRRLYKEVYNILSDCDDIVYISIECMDAGIWGKMTYKPDLHLVAPSDTVLNMDFDDVDVDCTDEEGNHWKAIDDEQGEEIAKFINKHLGKHFVIHCTAGRSRSQGVARAILDMFPDQYDTNPYTDMNPCLTPNYAVVTAIKRGLRKN